MEVVKSIFSTIAYQLILNSNIRQMVVPYIIESDRAVTVGPGVQKKTTIMHVEKK